MDFAAKIRSTELNAALKQWKSKFNQTVLLQLWIFNSFPYQGLNFVFFCSRELYRFNNLSLVSSFKSEAKGTWQALAVSGRPEGPWTSYFICLCLSFIAASTFIQSPSRVSGLLCSVSIVPSKRPCLSGAARILTPGENNQTKNTWISLSTSCRGKKKTLQK